MYAARVSHIISSAANIMRKMQVNKPIFGVADTNAVLMPVLDKIYAQIAFYNCIHIPACWSAHCPILFVAETSISINVDHA